MKYLLRLFLFNVFALWLTSELIPGVIVHGEWYLLLLAGAVLSVLMLIVKPMLKILFIPINLITFGLLSWVINVIVIYLLTFVLPEIEIQPWTFPGLTWSGFVIPPVHFNYVLTLIIVSVTITLFSNVLHGISEEN